MRSPPAIRRCVGEREGRIVAYGVLMLAPGEAQVLNLSVVPDARREGLGRALLRRFVDDAAARSAPSRSFSRSAPSNAAAIGSYEAEGFAAGRAPRRATIPAQRPAAPREDALVMRRALARRPA